jgi:hypothetical protein
MELKNVNPDGDNVVPSNLNNIKILNFFGKIKEIWFKKIYQMLYFLQDIVIVYKNKFLLFFISLINIK